MTISQITADVAELVPSSEETVHSQVGAGGVVLIVNLQDMASTNELLIRHVVSFPTAGPAVVGSKLIVHGTSTDDTWSAAAGDSNADGYQSWPFTFGDEGGSITLESLSGSYDVEYLVLHVGGPTG